MSEISKKTSIEFLINAMQKHRSISQEEAALVIKAYNTAQTVHSKQKRNTGEPYFIHPYNVALTLCEWDMDISTIIAGLLHDTIEDTDYKLETLTKEFGNETAFLVNGVTKLGHLKYRTTTKTETETEKNKRRAENLRKMMLATSEDLRVIFVKLADRLHNMNTLSAIPIQKQKRIAMETTEIYAPLAYRLGMQNISGELEDLAFPYIHPEEHKWIIENIEDRYEKRVKYLESVIPIIQETLAKNNIKPLKIDYRAKRISSLYKKLIRENMSIDQIYDLVAMRIIVNTIEECYTVLGIIHQLWPPLPGRIKDYIALPKPNGYRSLHTTVFCLDNKITEIQVRTMQMHEEAENGIAAHWAYAQAKTSKNFLKGKTSGVIADTKELKWVQQLKNWQGEFSDPTEFLNNLKIDFFKDRVFAITPKGEVIDLPSGATPIDFAYQIHTEVGNHCVGAKINNKIVPLDYQIQSGDMVEILTQKNKKPTESWLQFIKTSGAKSHIRQALRKTSTSMLRQSKTEIKITAYEKIGLIKDISTIISRMNINIDSIDKITMTKGSPYIGLRVICDMTDKEKIEKIVFKLKNIPQIKEIIFKFI